MADVDHRSIPLFQYLDTVGDTTGTDNAIGNYSDAGDGLTEFKVAPGLEEVYQLHRLVIVLSDAGTMVADGYGSSSALTNGIAAKIKNAAGTIVDFTSGDLIKANAEWAQICYDVAVLNFGTGNPNEYLTVRWTFTKGYGGPLILDGSKGEYFTLDLNDSMVHLLKQRFHAQGYKRAWY